MGESRQRQRAASSSVKGTLVHRSLPANKFGTVVLALYPVKPAVHLAQLADCTERHANLLIAGKRKPNAKIAHALMGEIIN